MAKTSRSSHRRLQALIEEATVDCYNEAEEFQGFVNLIEENVVCPFPAKVIGESVEVISLEGPPAGFGINAVCRYKEKEYRIDLNSLEWTRRRPKGFVWIEAYWEWLKRVG